MRDPYDDRSNWRGSRPGDDPILRNDPRYDDGRDYGGRPAARGNEGRGMVDRASDEVRSWFGDDRAERRRRMDERDDRMSRGRPAGPRDYAVSERYARGRAGGELAVDLMTTDVVTARHDDPVIRAARIMRDEDIGALPVVDRMGRPVGVITDRDITCRAVAAGEDVRRIRVDECMTNEVFSCDVDATLDDCMRQMSRHQIRRLLVCDRDGRLVGIISQADLARDASARRDMGERGRVADVLRDVSKPSGNPYH